MVLGIPRFADRGPVSAALAASGLLLVGLMLQLLLPLFSLLTLCLMIASGAVVAFVLLRHGSRAMWQAALMSSVALAVASALLSGSPVQLLLVQLLYWGPCVLAAAVLRQTVSFNLALLSILAAGATAVLAVWLFTGDPEAFWARYLSEGLLAAGMLPPAGGLGDGAQGPELLTAEQRDAIVLGLSAIMTGVVATSVMLVALCSLCLARAWQAALFNVGGFQREFHGVSLGRQAALICVLIMVAGLVLKGAVGSALAMVAMFGFFVQGLAVAHALVKQRELSSGWLVGLYVLMVLPHTLLLLGALGLVDNVYRLRQT